MYLDSSSSAVYECVNVAAGSSYKFITAPSERRRSIALRLAQQIELKRGNLVFIAPGPLASQFAPQIDLVGLHCFILSAAADRTGRPTAAGAASRRAPVRVPGEGELEQRQVSGGPVWQVDGIRKQSVARPNA